MSKRCTVAFVIALFLAMQIGGPIVSASDDETTMDCSFVPADPPDGGTFHINVRTHTCPLTSGGDCLPVTLVVSWGDGNYSLAYPTTATDYTVFTHTYGSQGWYDVVVNAQNHNGAGTCEIGTSYSW